MERVLTGSVQGVFEGLYCMKGMLEPSKSERVCHGASDSVALPTFRSYSRTSEKKCHGSSSSGCGGSIPFDHIRGRARWPCRLLLAQQRCYGLTRDEDGKKKMRG